MNDSTRERDEEGVRIDETLYRMIFLSTRPGLSLTKESNDSSQLIKIHMIIMNRWSHCHDRSNYKSIVSHLLTEWYNTCEIHNGYWMLGSVFLNLDCKDTERCKSERVRKWQIVKTACRGGIVHISDSAPHRNNTVKWESRLSIVRNSHYWMTRQWSFDTFPLWQPSTRTSSEKYLSIISDKKRWGYRNVGETSA